MSRKEIEERTEKLLKPITEDNGVSVYDVEYVKEGSDYYLRAYIDKDGGVTIDDCEAVSRALNDKLDEEDYIDDAYILEVSSPGLTRALKKPEHFSKSIGKDVEFKLFSPITYEEKGKKLSAKEFVGILKKYDESTDTVTIGFDDKELEILRKDISSIHLWIDF